MIVAGGTGALLTPGTAVADQAVDSGFVHPGILRTRADLDRMRAAVAAQQNPIYQGFQATAANARQEGRPGRWAISDTRHRCRARGFRGADAVRGRHRGAGPEVLLGIGAASPEPWSYRDIGDYVLDERQLGSYGVVAVRVPGITSYDSRTGSFTVRGAGSDLNVNGQGMTAQYAYQPVSGDRTITARVSARAAAGTSDRVGLIMTKSLSPFDQMAGTILTGTGAGQFLRRPIVAGSAVTTGGSGDAWLRLQRTGAIFTAATSPDGITWTTIGQDTIATFGEAPYYAGLAVCSGNPQALDATAFDHVQIG